MFSAVEQYKQIIIIEDGVKLGGAAETFQLELLARFPDKTIKVFGFGDEFYPHGTRDQILEHVGLDSKSIISMIKGIKGGL